MNYFDVPVLNSELYLQLRRPPHSECARAAFKGYYLHVDSGRAGHVVREKSKTEA